MIEHLVVDLGGVAAQFRPEIRLAALAARTGLDPAVVGARLFGSGLDDSAELGAIPAGQIADRVIGQLDGRIDLEALVNCWALAFDPSTLLLQRLRHLDMRVTLFTNNGPLLDRCLGGPLCEIDEAFDDIICSWHLRARKPSDEAFAGAVERLGGRPERILLLDDSSANVAAARRNGWNAAHVNSGSAMAALDRWFGH